MIQSTLLPTSSLLLQFNKFQTNKIVTQFESSIYTRSNGTIHNVLKKQTQQSISKEPLVGQSSSSPAGLCQCGRRHLLAPTIATALLLSFPSFASEFNYPSSMANTIDSIRPSKPGWYEELYASMMHKCMNSYETEIGKYKADLFRQLKGQAKVILEIGIGTGPNLKYYADDTGMRVIGVDPNIKMEKYARGAAETAGLSPANFEFVHAVGEILPLNDASVDAVIGTLVLCSVKDVDRTLQEVKRVLKPGGLYLFVEHVGAQDGTFLRFVQNILNPVQQLLADNCHLTRDSGRYIAEAGFSEVNSSITSISKALVVNPQVYGIARK